MASTSTLFFSRIGSFAYSQMTEVQFQRHAGNGWVLADGRSVVGSKYEDITSNSTIPDARGRFLRAKNNGRSDGKEDPSGELALGSSQDDQNEAHSHTFTPSSHSHSVDVGRAEISSSAGIVTSGTGTQLGTVQTSTTSANGVDTQGEDFRPNNVCWNIFIRIN